MARDYGRSREYVPEVIRKNQDRQELRGPLLAGAASPPTKSWCAALLPMTRRPDSSSGAHFGDSAGESRGFVGSGERIESVSY